MTNQPGPFKVYKVDLTPNVATEYLASMSYNRPLSKKWVKFLSSQIKEGSWILSPEPIVFDKSGVLIDGQHRCHAVIEADKAIPIMVSHGWDEDVYKKLDRGRKRRLRDDFHQVKKTSDGHTSLLSCGRMLTHGPFGVGSTILNDNDYLEHILEHEEALKRFVVVQRNGCYTAPVLPRISCVAAAFVTAFIIKDHDEAIYESYKRLYTMSFHDPKDPMKALFNYLAQETYRIKSPLRHGVAAYLGARYALESEMANRPLSVIKFSAANWGDFRNAIKVRHPKIQEWLRKRGFHCGFRPKD